MSPVPLPESAPSPAPQRVLFVHAHPDDETISTGGTIARLIDDGTAVTVITCTRGECGEIVPPELQHLLGDGDAIAAHRETEIAEAMRILGVTDHRWLGGPDARMVGREPRMYRDSGMVWGESGPELGPDVPADALCVADAGEVAADIATVIAGVGATAVVSYDANGGYGHPDHIAAHTAARHAARVMNVPFYEIVPPGTLRPQDLTDPDVSVVEIAPVRARKLAALRAHRSQLTVIGAGAGAVVGVGASAQPGASVHPVASGGGRVAEIEGERMAMSGGQVDEIGSVEAFRREGHPVAHLDWSDYSRRARVLACVLAASVGAALGALGTVNHQVSIDLFGTSVPIGLVLALIVVTATLVGLRLIFDNRIVVGVASLALLVVIAVLAAESAGGSVLIPDSTIAYGWLYGSVIVVAVVLAWPKLSHPSRVTIVGSTQPKGFTSP
jgi:N-acetyl-1-D-myo-inositol-2-amino-2-deoxy-alpha-D-glucopyranoside deacetylase